MSSFVVVDYGLGNIRSISNALARVGADAVVTHDADAIARARGVVVPGVGAFAHGMANLRERGLVGPLLEYVASGRPLLGICLGMQMLLESSDEYGAAEGLGVIPGRVTRLEVEDQARDRLPHVMWNTLAEVAPGDISLRPSEQGRYFYFVHSYAARPRDAEHALAWTAYGGHRFCSAVRKGRVLGVQFHPEKSGPEGLLLLERFVQSCAVTP